ncbi:MAG: curli assembly protein CsgF [Bacteroidales bacterium]
MNDVAMKTNPKTRKRMFLLAFFALALVPAGLFAQDFVYQPINPAFGGNPYNYTWLLGSAQAQNTHTEEDLSFGSYTDDPLADFQENIDSQILNEISKQLYTTQFGENGLEEGSYEFGSYQIEVSPTSEGMQIKIMDITTGSETTVIIPYY